MKQICTVQLLNSDMQVMRQLLLSLWYSDVCPSSWGVKGRCPKSKASNHHKNEVEVYLWEYKEGQFPAQFELGQ